MKKTHETRLLSYLREFGNITSLEAIRDLGNTRLSATIFKLRKKGYIIESEPKRVATRFSKENGEKVYTSVANYTFKY